MRAYKTVNDTYIEPISFTVPRRAETFQADIFPPAIGSKPAVSAQEWLDGKTDIPTKIDFESIYEGQAPKEVPSDYKPPPKVEPAPAAKAAPKAEEPKPAPAAARGPPPTMKEQKGSIAAMASKYQDNEEEEQDEDDETSSFEEIPKPSQRATQQPVRTETKPAIPTAKIQSTTTTTPAVAAAGAAAPPSKATSRAETPTPTAASSSSDGIETSLDEIKKLIENQTRVINAQNDKINILVSEVESLKKRVGASSGGSQDQSERIRQLELELEEARS